MLGWVRAIDAARGYLRAVNPQKERYMVRLFGLDAPLPRGQPVRARLVRLCAEMNVSESTLYKWREDILEIVLYAAMEAGVVGLFGIRETAEHEEECEQAREQLFALDREKIAFFSPNFVQGWEQALAAAQEKQA